MPKIHTLLVAKGERSRTRAKQCLQRGLKSVLIFEVASLAEAHTLLEMLQIDLMVIDLDTENVNLSELNEDHPELMIMGLYSAQSKLVTTIYTHRNRVFRKESLRSEMHEALKEFRKEWQSKAAGLVPAGGTAPEFENYQVLLN